MVRTKRTLKMNLWRAALIFLSLTLLIFMLFIFIQTKTNDTNLVCRDLLSRDNKLFVNKEFSTSENERLRQALYQCSLKKEKSSVFLEQRMLSDLDTNKALKHHFSEVPKEQVIGVMGAASLPRGTKVYRETALMGKHLRENNYVIITGGGTGAMEASHLGVWFAGRTDNELKQAIDELQNAPLASDPNYMKLASEIKHKYPRILPGHDIGFSTFVFLDNPPNAFSHFSVVYFNDALREQALLRASTGAVIFVAGGAGTNFELHFALAQNAYQPVSSTDRPLILLGKAHWEKKLSPRLRSKVQVMDEIENVIRFLNKTCTP